jgi:hypothetical protein
MKMAFPIISVLSNQNVGTKIAIKHSGNSILNKGKRGKEILSIQKGFPP